MKLVRDTCEELQSSTFSILFHPIKEQLMTVDSAQMLGNSLRFSCQMKFLLYLRNVEISFLKFLYMLHSLEFVIECAVSNRLSID